LAQACQVVAPRTPCQKRFSMMTVRSVALGMVALCTPMGSMAMHEFSRHTLLATPKQQQPSLVAQAAAGAGRRGALATGSCMDLDVPYGRKDENKVDIYWPSDATRKPTPGWSAVIIVPGHDSKRKYWAAFCTKHIAPSGRLCAVSGYRVDDEHRADDVYKMIAWFSRRAGDWNVDKTRVVVAGLSVGGIAINDVIWDPERGKDLLDGVAPKVRAVMLLSATKERHPQLAANALYWPPATFICSSDTDDFAPYVHSQRLQQALQRLGKPVKFVTIPDSGHAIWFSAHRSQWYAEVMSFLDEEIPLWREVPIFPLSPSGATPS